MTTLVALSTKDALVMGCDSLASVTQISTKDKPKVKYPKASSTYIIQSSPKSVSAPKVPITMLSVKEGRQYKTYTQGGGVLLSRKPIRGSRVVHGRRGKKAIARLSRVQ